MCDIIGKASYYVIFLLVVALGITYVDLSATEKRLIACTHQREVDKLSYKNAQETAKALSLQQSLEKERENAEKAKKADEAYGHLLSKYNSSILLYQAGTTNRSTGSINLSSTSNTSNGSYSTSESTTISITLDDAGICAENTARLQAVKQWASGVTSGEEVKVKSD